MNILISLISQYIEMTSSPVPSERFKEYMDLVNRIISILPDSEMFPNSEMLPINSEVLSINSEYTDHLPNEYKRKLEYFQELKAFRNCNFSKKETLLERKLKKLKEKREQEQKEETTPIHANFQEVI